MHKLCKNNNKKANMEGRGHIGKKDESRFETDQVQDEKLTNNWLIHNQESGLNYSPMVIFIISYMV